jgi:adenylate cyclase
VDARDREPPADASDQSPPSASPSLADPAVVERWRRVLAGEDPGFRRFRSILRAIPSSPRCKQCNGPFAGIGGPVMRAFGKGPWEKNPHFCAQCYTMLQREAGGVEIELSMLFADVRGSTGIAERLGARAFTELLNRFYRAAAQIVIDSDGMVDKFVGDEVVALFVPGWSGADHARRAVEAADAILLATGHLSGQPWLPVGAGVHTGTAYVGTVGVGGIVTDFTALGDAVNTTARLASIAKAGEVLVSRDNAAAAGLDTDGLASESLELRGRVERLVAYPLPAGQIMRRLGVAVASSS